MENNRLLIVDDEKDIVQAYVDFLSPSKPAPKRSSRGAGASAPTATGPEYRQYQLIPCYSGAEALEAVKKELAAGRRVAGGFFDVKMEGGMDGLQTIREIWKLDPEMHCTVVTAYHDRSVDDIDQLFGERFKDQWDYLNKPFTQAEIVQKARQMLAAWNRKRRLESTQEQLVRSERMAAVGQVARAIGHEFGNLLQAIMGKADLALSETDPAKLKEKLELILKASERASIIVRNLQSFSKGSATPAAVEVPKLLEATLTLVNHELKKNNVEPAVQAQADMPKVFVNAGELEQVFLNLIINAIHAMPKGGKLEMGCSAEGGHVVAWVEDSGTGIPDEVLPRIFEYAFTTKGDKGSGLGLAICKEIIEKHQGTIEVKTVLGKGTRFTVRLPKAK